MISEQQLFSCVSVADLIWSTYTWLALPHDPDAAPNEAVARMFLLFCNLSLFKGLLGHPHFQHWRDIGHKYKQYWHGPDATPEVDRGVNNPNRHRYGTCRVQAVRSVCDWSHGVLTEASIQAACACSEDMCEIVLLTSFYCRYSVNQRIGAFYIYRCVNIL